MDSESKGEDTNESDISRFTLDGVVAEMVVEVDEVEAISPTKTLKLDGLEKYNALKASALRQSIVLLESNLKAGEKDTVKRKEIQSDSEEAGENMPESDNLESSIDKPALDSCTAKVVADVECIEDKPKDSQSKESEIIEKQPKISEEKAETSEVPECCTPEGNPSIALDEKHSKGVMDQNSVDSEKLVSETSAEKLVEQSEEETIITGKRKLNASEISPETESSASKTHLEDEPAVEEKQLSKKFKGVKRKTRTIGDQSSKSETVTTFPESKRTSLRTNAAKSVLIKAKVMAQNKVSRKVTTTTAAVIRGSKRKLLNSEPKKEVAAKKQKDSTPETKLRAKSNKSIPSVSKASVSKRPYFRRIHTLVPPPVKSKAYNLYPKCDSRLNSFVEVKEQLNISDLKYLRALYRLMYDRWPPRDLDDLKKEILQFQGFTFNRKSDELEKRQTVLKKLPDVSVLQICKILDLKEGSKDNMISEIIKFLLKPIKVIYSVVDPFQPSMQPFVKLEKMSLDLFYTRSVKNWDDAINKDSKVSKRKRFPSSRLSEYVSPIDSGSSDTRTPNKVLSSAKSEAAKLEKKRPGRPKKQVNISETDDSTFSHH